MEKIWYVEKHISDQMVEPVSFSNFEDMLLYITKYNTSNQDNNCYLRVLVPAGATDDERQLLKQYKATHIA